MPQRTTALRDPKSSKTTIALTRAANDSQNTCCFVDNIKRVEDFRAGLYDQIWFAGFPKKGVVAAAPTNRVAFPWKEHVAPAQNVGGGAAPIIHPNGTALYSQHTSQKKKTENTECVHIGPSACYRLHSLVVIFNTEEEASRNSTYSLLTMKRKKKDLPFTSN